MGNDDRVLRVRGRVVTPTEVVLGEVICEQDRVVEVRADDTVVRDGGDVCWVCPGFIDLQLNGTDGVDLTTRPEGVDAVAARLPAEGVTAFAPTVITCDADVRRRAVEILGRSAVAWDEGDHRGSATPIGVHLEGPLLVPARAGAHPIEHLAHVTGCDTAGWTPDAGVVLVTVAPELPGALELIAELRAAGVVVALGHTDATAEQFQAGLDAGASHVTHLFNAMRPFSHRDPGPIGVALADDQVTAGLIVDGLHVDPVAVRMAWRSLGPDRIDLVTDAVAARGLGRHPDGVRTRDGVLAGSTVHLDAALRALVAATGAPLIDAVRTVTSTPARVLGVTDRGAVEPGRRADLTVLDGDLRVVETVVGGVSTAAAVPPPRA